MSDYFCYSCFTELEDDLSLCDKCFSLMKMDEWITFEETPYSTRNQNGQIKYFKTIEEALIDFFESEGYRLSIITPEKQMHFYREELPDLPKSKPGSIGYDNPSANITYNAKIMVQRSISQINNKGE